MIGKKILNYQINSLIGGGGMGTVYLATNIHIDQKVAIKVLNVELTSNQEIKDRFKREATTLSSLDHPNIVKFINYYEDENGVYLIMEYIKGRTLDEYITNEMGPIAEEKTLELFAPILEAFNYAHDKGIIHRDIKPANILITNDFRVKILDFGIARILNESAPSMTKVGTKMGTAMYMSPEQVKAKEVDKRSDIFSLGVVLHQMVTGKAPYDDTTMSEFEIHRNVVENELPRAKTIYPFVSDEIQSIIDKATAKHPENRYPDCNYFRYALYNIRHRNNNKSTDTLPFSEVFSVSQPTTLDEKGRNTETNDITIEQQNSNVNDCNQPEQKRPKNYILFSILVPLFSMLIILFCRTHWRGVELFSILVLLLSVIPCGTIAYLFASKVNKCYDGGQYQKAIENSDNAKTWCVIGVCAVCIFLFISYFYIT